MKVKATTQGSRTYLHPEFGKVRSVTSILSSTIPKPQLTYWAGSCAAEHIEVWAKSNAFDGTRGFINEKMISLGSTLKQCSEAKRAHMRKSKEATTIGQEAHDAVEFFLRRAKWPKMSPAVAMAVAGFEEFAAEVDLKVISIENVVFGQGLPYAGRFDIRGTVRGKEYVLDNKTSKAVYDEYAIQVVAYAKPINVGNIGVIRLAKDKPLVEFVDFSSVFDEAWETWASLLDADIAMHKFTKAVKKSTEAAEIFNGKY